MRPTILAYLALAAFLAFPTVSAESGQIHVSSLAYAGSSQQEGTLTFLAFAEASPSPSLGSGVVPGNNVAAPAAHPWIDLSAAEVQATTYVSQYLYGPSVPAGPTVQTQPVPPQRDDLQQVGTQLKDHQVGFQLHLYSLGAPVAFSASANDGTLSPMAPVVLSTNGLRDSAGTAQPESGSSDANYFSVRQDAGPLIVHNTPSPDFTLQAHGDFVVELFGLTLDGHANGKAVTWSSGSFDHPVVTGLPDATAVVAAQHEERFVRLALHDATLKLASQGGAPLLQWAAPTLDSSHDGAVTLKGATGKIHALGGDQQLNGDWHVVPAGSHLRSTPQPKGLGVQLSDSVPPTGLASVGALPATASVSLVGIGAILALACAVAVGLLRRFLQAPELPDVEKAIEGGQYRLAARLASRILHRSPGLEDALLARAIALSKGGRPERAVAELKDHMADHDVTDGSLHYVLGVACLDLGRATEGRAALQEAVRRTPSLGSEVAARLGSAPATTVHKEAHGYA